MRLALLPLLPLPLFSSLSLSLITASNQAPVVGILTASLVACSKKQPRRNRIYRIILLIDCRAATRPFCWTRRRATRRRRTRPRTRASAASRSSTAPRRGWSRPASASSPAPTCSPSPPGTPSRWYLTLFLPPAHLVSLSVSHSTTYHHHQPLHSSPPIR